MRGWFVVVLLLFLWSAEGSSCNTPQSSMDYGSAQTTSDDPQPCIRYCAAQGHQYALRFPGLQKCTCMDAFALCVNAPSACPFWYSTKDFLVENCITQNDIQFNNSAITDNKLCLAFCSVHNYAYAVFGSTINGCGCINTYAPPSSCVLSYPYANKIVATNPGYLGCYSVPPPGSSSHITSVQNCKQYCSRNSYRYAYISGGNQCGCSNTYGLQSPKCPASAPGCNATDLVAVQMCNSACTDLVADGWTPTDFCGGSSAASFYEAYGTNGFHVTNFQGGNKAGPIGKYMQFVGDAKQNQDFFAILTQCRTSLQLFKSKGGIWTTEMQSFQIGFDAFFSFSVDPCTAENPTGYITLVFQAEGPNVRPYAPAGYDPRVIGIPNAFAVSIQLNNGWYTVFMWNTDCQGQPMMGTSFNISGNIPLYAINDVEVYLSPSDINRIYVLVNGANVGNIPANALPFGDRRFYVGVIACHGQAGNSQISLLSFGFNNCGWNPGLVPGTAADGFTVNCSASASTATWSNSFNKNGIMTLQSRNPVVLDIQQEFDEASVLGCYEAAYHGGAGSGTTQCVGVASVGNLFMQIGSTIKNGSTSTGQVNVTLNSLNGVSSSNWNISGFWDDWTLFDLIQQNVTVTVIPQSTDFSSQIFLPNSHVDFYVSTTGVTNSLFSSTGAIVASTQTSFSSLDPLKYVYVSLEYSFADYISLNAYFKVLVAGGGVPCPITSDSASATILWRGVYIPFSFALSYDKCALATGESAYSVNGGEEVVNICFTGFPCASQPVSLQISGATNNATSDVLSLEQATFQLSTQFNVYSQRATLTAYITPYSSDNSSTAIPTPPVTYITFDLRNSLFQTLNMAINFTEYSNCSAPLSGVATVVTGTMLNVRTIPNMNIKYWHCAEFDQSIAANLGNNRVWEFSATMFTGLWQLQDFSTPLNAQILLRSGPVPSNGHLDTSTWDANFTYTVQAWNGRVPAYFSIFSSGGTPTNTLSVTYESDISEYVNTEYVPIFYADGYATYNYALCNENSTGTFATFNLILLGQTFAMNNVPFMFKRCVSQLTSGNGAIVVDYRPANFPLLLPGGIATSNAHLVFSSRTSGSGSFTKLRDILSWDASIYVSTASFASVVLDLFGNGALRSITATGVSSWSSFIQTSMEITLGEDGYVPYWGNMTATVGDFSFSAVVGYLSFGWNYHVHQDGSLVLTSPPVVSDSTYTPLQHNGSAEDTSATNSHFQWVYPPIFGADENQTVYWDQEEPFFSSTAHSFRMSADSDGEIHPIFIALSPSITTSMGFSGFTLSSYFVQMMGYSYVANEIYWEARVIATTSDGKTIIVEVDSDGSYFTPPPPPPSRNLEAEIETKHPTQNEQYQEKAQEVVQIPIQEVVETPKIELEELPFAPQDSGTPKTRTVHTLWNRDDPPPMVEVVFVNSSSVLLVMDVVGDDETGFSATGQLTLSALTDSVIVMSITASYTVEDDEHQWIISGSLDSGFTFVGFTVPNITVTFIGTAEGDVNPVTDILQFDWEGIVESTALIPEINMVATLFVAFDSNSLTNITFHVVKEFDFGVLDGTLSYYAYAINLTEYEQVNPEMAPPPEIIQDFSGPMTCNTSGVYRELLGFATFAASFPSASNALFSASVSYDICSGAWSFTGEAQNFSIGDAFFPDVQLAVASDQGFYSFYLSGQAKFAGLNASVTVSVNTDETYFIAYIADEVDGVSVDVEMSYVSQDGAFVASGEGNLFIESLFDDGGNLVASINITYANKPEIMGEKMWQIWGTFEGGSTIHDQPMGSLDVYLFKLNANSSWVSNLTAQVHLPSFGVDAFASILLNGSTIQHFYASIDYQEGDNLFLAGTIDIPGSGQCAKQLASGTGSAMVKNLGALDDFEVDMYLEVSCNNSGYFHAILQVTDDDVAGCSIGGRHFGFSNSLVNITRKAAGAPVDFSLTANFFGMENLHVASAFQISPFSNFSAVVTYSDHPSVKRKNSERRREAGAALTAKSPGDILATFGKNSKSPISSLQDLGFSNFIPSIVGPTADVYYDMFSHATISGARIDLQTWPLKIYAAMNVSFYDDVDVDFYISLVKMPTTGTWAFAAAVQLDLDHLGGNDVLDIIVDEVDSIMFLISSTGGVFNFNGKQVQIFANSITIFTELKLASPSLQSFIQKGNTSSTIGDTKLDALAVLATDEILLLVELGGTLKIGGAVNITKLWLSLRVSSEEADFGFVAAGNVDLGTDVHGVRKVVYLTLNIYLIASPEGFGFGVFMAVCMDEPYEIANELFLLFPIKFKFEMTVLPEPMPLALGFAGGFQIGDGSKTAMSAYVQVLIDVVTPSQSSFYLSMGKFDLYNLLYNLAGSTIANGLPSFISDFITFESLVLRYNMNPDAPVQQATNTTVPAGESDCSNTLSLMQMNSPPYGILFNLTNLNIAKGFIIVDQASISMVPDSYISMNVKLEPITAIPGITITDASGNHGPVFKLDMRPPATFDILLSGGVNLLNLYQAQVEYSFNATYAHGRSVTHFGDAEISWDLTFDYKNPLNGIMAAVDAKNLTDALIDIMQEAVTALFDEFNAGLQAADEALGVADQKLREAQDRLDSAKKQADAELSDLQTAVAKAQGKVNSRANTCHHYKKKCHWYSPWNCVKEGVCYIEYAIEWAALQTAQGALDAAKAGVDAGFAALNGALGAAEASLEEAQALDEDLQDQFQNIGSKMGSFFDDARSIIDIHELSAHFTIRANTSPNVGLLIDFDFFGHHERFTFDCVLGWPEIGKCMKPYFVDLVNDYMKGIGSGLGLKKRSVPDFLCEVQVSRKVAKVNARGLSGKHERTLPACAFAHPSLTALDASSAGFVGEIPAPAVTSTVKTVCLGNNNFHGNFSFVDMPHLSYLDVSNNRLTHGLHSIATHNPKLKYLNIKGNPLQEDILDIIPKMKNLQYLRMDPRQVPNARPVEFAALSGMRFMLRLNLDEESNLCSDCTPVIRFSGECHNYSCANRYSIVAITAYIDSLIGSRVQSHNISYPPHSISIVHTMQQSETSTLCMMEFTGTSVPFQSIQEALHDLTATDPIFELLDVFPVCPPNLLGLACAYACKSGYQALAPPDGRGGYVRPLFLGVYVDEIFEHARPSCLLPENCTHTCFATLQRTQLLCQEFAETYTEDARTNCQQGIDRARFFCANDSADFCLNPVIEDFVFILDSVNNRPHAELSATQVTLEIRLTVPDPLSATDQNFIMSVLTVASGGEVEQSLVSKPTPGYQIMAYSCVVDRDSNAKAAISTLGNIISGNLLRNIYKIDADAVPGSLYFSENVAYLRSADVRPFNWDTPYAAVNLVDGDISTTLKLPAYPNWWQVALDTPRSVSRIVLFGANGTIGNFWIYGYSDTNYVNLVHSTLLPVAPNVVTYTHYFEPPIILGSVKLQPATGAVNTSILSQVEIFAKIKTCDVTPCSGSSVCPTDPDAFPECECPPGQIYTGEGGTCIPGAPEVYSATNPPTIGDFVYINGSGFANAQEIKLGTQRFPHGTFTIMNDSTLQFKVGGGVYTTLQNLQVQAKSGALAYESAARNVFSYAVPTITSLVDTTIQHGYPLIMCGANFGFNIQAYPPSTPLVISAWENNTWQACTSPKIYTAYTCVSCTPTNNQTTGGSKVMLQVANTPYNTTLNVNYNYAGISTCAPIITQYNTFRLGDLSNQFGSLAAPNFLVNFCGVPNCGGDRFAVGCQTSPGTYSLGNTKNTASLALIQHEKIQFVAQNGYADFSCSSGRTSLFTITCQAGITTPTMNVVGNGGCQTNFNVFVPITFCH